jgi:hypothetical protein
LKINIEKGGSYIASNKNDMFEGGQTLKAMYPAFLTRFNYATMSVSDPSCFLKTNDGSQTNPLQFLEVKKYEIIGFHLKCDSFDYVFWYEPTEALLNELNENDRKKIEDYLNANKDNRGNIEVNINSPKEIPFEKIAGGEKITNASIKTITLTEAQLAKLLIRVVDKKIVMKLPTGRDKKTGKLSAIQITNDKNGSLTTFPTPLENFDSNYYSLPVMLTDDLGLYAKAAISGSKTYELDKITSYNLIPVLVKSGEDYTTMDQLTKRLRPDIIFWYEPTEQFLKILDDKTASEIRNDIAALNCNRTKITFTAESACDDKSTLSCNYFEACQNTISKAINKYAVFPNPTKEKFNLKLDLNEACSVTVSMITLNGTEVKTYSLGAMKQGISEKEMTTEGITPGLYLLRITTDKGDLFNERILISE